MPPPVSWKSFHQVSLGPKKSSIRPYVSTTTAPSTYPAFSHPWCSSSYSRLSQEAGIYCKRWQALNRIAAPIARQSLSNPGWQHSLPNCQTLLVLLRFYFWILDRCGYRQQLHLSLHFLFSAIKARFRALLRCPEDWLPILVKTRYPFVPTCLRHHVCEIWHCARSFEWPYGQAAPPRGIPSRS